jgi:predicted metalloprotease with PDZ domain
MLKSINTTLLTGMAILLTGAFFLAKGGEHRKVPPNRNLLLAMQGTAPQSAQSSSRPPNVGTGWIGVMLENAVEHGIRIGTIFPGGPAAFAGVRVGDVLVKVGDVAVDSSPVAERAIENLSPQKQTKLTIRRGKETLRLNVLPENYAEFQENYIAEMMRRDPRHPKYAQHHGISEADMQAELVRRQFEQHERIERRMQLVLDEVRALRKQVAALQETKGK